MHAHRQLPADSELAQATTVLARAQQDAVWSRQQVANQVRSLLREYYPAALHAFQGKEGGLTRADTRTVLTLAPTPAKAAKLTLAQLRAALKRSGRFDTETARLREIFRSEYARHHPAVEDAFGQQLLALLKQLDAEFLSGQLQGPRRARCRDARRSAVGRGRGPRPRTRRRRAGR